MSKSKSESQSDSDELSKSIESNFSYESLSQSDLAKKKKKLEKYLIKKADVVCTTCMTSSDFKLWDFDF